MVDNRVSLLIKPNFINVFLVPRKKTNCATNNSDFQKAEGLGGLLFLYFPFN